MSYIPLAVPFFILAILLEFIYGWVKKNNTYRLNDTISSLFMGSLSTASKIVLIGVGGSVFYAIETHYALWRMDDSLVITWIFAFVAQDFCYYWLHRFGHERQIFWASHVAHHQSEEYNLSTALRQTSMSFLLSWIFYVPLFLIGMPAMVFVTVASINLIYQFWVHSQHIPKLGWYELFFITPSNHRVHHAQNEIYIDKNYGGIFVIWDRIFGTFQEEQEDEPCIYGIRGPIKTFNPLWANVHIYFGIFRNFFKTKNWKDKFHVLVARTGWQPEDIEEVNPTKEFDASSFVKYDPAVNRIVAIYGFIQLIILTIAAPFIIEDEASSYYLGALGVGMILFTMISTTKWLDGKSAMHLEIPRLIIFSLCAIAGLQYYENIIGIIVLIGYVLLNLLVLPFLKNAVDNQHDAFTHE